MSSASFAVTTARTWIVDGVVSVTASDQSRPSHAAHSPRMSRSCSRIAATGAEWSRWRKTVPVIWTPPRDQFSNGLLVKYETGIVIRRSSQVRTARKVSVISSTVPHSPSTTTVSPIRTMSPNAICSPAKRLPSVDWAATPATMPSTPAEASIEVPTVRIAGNVSSIAATATVATTAVTTRWISVTCVRTRRTRAGSRVAAA